MPRVLKRKRKTIGRAPLVSIIWLILYPTGTHDSFLDSYRNQILPNPIKF